MADDLSTETVAEEVDTSTDTGADDNDSTSDDDDVSLEDIEVTPEELGDTNPDLEESEDEEDTESDATDEEESDDTEEAEPEQSEEQKQAAFKQQMYERRQAEKQERLASQRDKQQEYLDDAQDEQDLALRQLQIEAYDNKVERNSNSLTNGYERAIKDFDVLRNATPEIQAEIDSAIDAFQAMHVTVDAYGNPTNVNADLYSYLQAKADSISKLTGIRSVRQEQSKTKEKSKTFTPTSRAPKAPKVDPMLAAFDEEAWK